ncbi:MAG TPA: extracellular solute-binding protein [Phycisphaerales bacterium]|nr:extracellular solute-binding protein [Phycisphaerales bacterium]
MATPKDTSQHGTSTEGAPRWIGPIVMTGVAIASAVLAMAFPAESREGSRMWVAARLHHEIYVPAVEEWNQAHPLQVHMTLLGTQAVEQRMLSAFMARTPTAELVEVERRPAARAFAGPIDSVGFLDLTERLRADGLLETINGPSFTPWTSRGRIFGIPHDVHPVMLGYRADIVEAAGIDVSQIETWDDFARVLGPLMLKPDGTKRDDRFLLNMWDAGAHIDVMEVLTLQAGGGLVDERGVPTLDHPANARVLAHTMSWAFGPDRIAADAPYFTASGNKLLVDGFVLASFVPDWMCNIWRKEIPQLSGKVKLMPLPAWERGGRRTSVWGGTMLGISRDAKNPDELWEFAKHLYISPERARDLFVQGDIISPVRAFWTDPVYDQLDPYFCNQARGRLYVNLAGEVPQRYNSPFSALALLRMQACMTKLAAYARTSGDGTAERLLPEARRLLKEAQSDIMRHVKRNRFFVEETGLTFTDAGEVAR